MFQRTFDLTQDGVVGPATWNRINFIFVAITDLAELTSEGIRTTIGERPPNVVLRQGSRGVDVTQLQFILNIISRFYPEVPSVIEDGVFDARTLNSVREFQRRFGLNADGVVGPATWNRLYEVYRGIDRNTSVPHPPPPPNWVRPTYPGFLLRNGSRGEAVRIVQQYLTAISAAFPNIRPLTPDGNFGPLTEASVRAFQREFGLVPDGVVGPLTWNKIFDVYEALQDNTANPLPPQPPTPPVQPPPPPPPITPPPTEVPLPRCFTNPAYPGTLMRQGSTGENVRLMQQYLIAINRNNRDVPAPPWDGNFGTATDVSVRAFQRQYGLNSDGIIGPLTWARIIEVYNRICEGNPIPPTGGGGGTAPPNYFLYTVVAGDNLWTLGQRFGTTMQAIMQLNGMANDLIFPGQVIRIPRAAQAAARSANVAVTPLAESVGSASSVSSADSMEWKSSANLAPMSVPSSTSNGSRQYPGMFLRFGSQGDDVRFMQQALVDLRALNPDLPNIAVDGVFGPRTETAVRAFQRWQGLIADGIIGPITWYAIVDKRGLLV